MDKSEKLSSEIELNSNASLPPDAYEKINFIYVNNTFMSGSNWDVRFVFAERLPTGKVEPRVGIVMSHQHAKALLETLAVNVRNIESLVGEIKYKPSLQQEKETKH